MGRVHVDLQARRAVPVAKPLIAAASKKAASRAVASGWLSGSGPYVAQFENSFASLVGSRYAVAVPSGTAALHLALTSLGIGDGDEVIVPTFTMAAPVFAILYCKAKPVFVDSEPEHFTLDTKLIEAKITKKTKAIIAVHIYGHPCDIGPLQMLCKRYKLALVEDAAEGLGAYYRGKPVGSFGDVACFSLYANKLVTTGEGGMVVTKDRGHYERLASLRDMSHHPTHRFLHTDLGFTYRFSNVLAAIGLAQMDRVAEVFKRKRAIGQYYTEHLASVPFLELPHEKPWAKHIYWAYPLLTKKNFRLNRDAIQKKLAEAGIETRPFFIPLHNQPVMVKNGCDTKESFPVASDISKRGLYIPSGPAITKAELSRVVNVLRNI